jgi:hypothetical protein
MYHWRMLILECSQGCCGRTDRRTDGSVTISLCNFTGEGIINQEVNLIPMLQRSTYGLNTKVWRNINSNKLYVEFEHWKCLLHVSILLSLELHVSILLSLELNVSILLSLELHVSILLSLEFNVSILLSVEANIWSYLYMFVTSYLYMFVTCKYFVECRSQYLIIPVHVCYIIPVHVCYM